MTRSLTEHRVNPGNNTIVIDVVDEPGHGGASHEYVVCLPNGETTIIEFQNGPINVDGNGVNGLTHEVLLAIVADRLRGFQKGQYACRENALALTKLEEAMMWLKARTIGRMQRGVEGTHTV